MYKVRCTLIEFLADEEKFPCHFNYKIGEEFFYDGVRFTGRICPGLFASMMPVIHSVFTLGHRYSENTMFRYRGADTRDPNMLPYDGAGFRPVDPSEKGPPDAMAAVMTNDPATGKARGAHFTCADTRTLAHFACEPIDLSDSEYAQPFYRKAIAILEKIEAEPGIHRDQILDRFTEFERNGLGPVLTPVLFEMMLESLVDMKYIQFKNGDIFGTGKEPPSRPVIG